MPTFWARSAMFFTTSLAFVVALAWKDAVHTMFQTAFPLVSPTILQRKSVAMFSYALVATALALVVVSLLPYHEESSLSPATPKPREECAR
jgi:hypothetical protein